jgi:hypothetical protein
MYYITTSINSVRQIPDLFNVSFDSIAGILAIPPENLLFTLGGITDWLVRASESEGGLPLFIRAFIPVIGSWLGIYDYPEAALTL